MKNDMKNDKGLVALCEPRAGEGSRLLCGQAPSLCLYSFIWRKETHMLSDVLRK